MAYADIKLGYTCNNNCIHCVIADQREKAIRIRGNQDRGTEEYKGELYDSRMRGCNSVTFTGGEPTLRKDLFELLAYARSIGYQCNMQTNGRAFYYKEFAERIAPFNVNFTIALHGHTPEIHDKITRAKGSFEQTTEGIKNLISLGQNIHGKVVISKLNYMYLDKIAETLIKLGVKAMNIAFPHAQGNAWTNFDTVVPRYSEIIDDVHKCIKYVEKYNSENCTAFDYYTNCVESFFGVKIPRKLDIFINDTHKEKVQKLINRNNDEKLIVIAPHSQLRSEHRLKKDFPVSDCKKLANELSSHGKVVFVGTRDDYKEGLSDIASDKILNLIGEISLVESAAIIKQSDLFIGVDSGLLHVAAALNKKMIGLFGETDPRYLAPYDNMHVINMNNTLIDEIIESVIKIVQEDKQLSNSDLPKEIKDKIENKEIKNVLIISANGVGDFIRSLPIIHFLDSLDIKKSIVVREDTIEFINNLDFEDVHKIKVHSPDYPNDNFADLKKPETLNSYDLIINLSLHSYFDEWLKDTDCKIIFPNDQKSSIKINLDFEAIPFCFMVGYEEYVAELKSLNNTYSELKQLDGQAANWQVVRKQIKSKFPQCNECKYDNICEGPWNEYPEKYGIKEFKAVR